MTLAEKIRHIEIQMSHAYGRRWHQLAAELYRLYQSK